MEVGCWKSPQNHPGSTFVYSIDILTVKNKFDEWFWEIQETQHFYILLWPSDQVRTIYYVMGKHICCLIPPEKHVIPHQDFLTVCCKSLILLVLKPICVKLYFTFSYRVPYLSKTIWWHFPTMVMMPNSASWMVISILPSEASVGATLYWIDKSFSLREKVHLNIEREKCI